jgi:hypothetical protein
MESEKAYQLLGISMDDIFKEVTFLIFSGQVYTKSLDLVVV